MSESLPLTADEITALRMEAESEYGYPGKHGQWEHLVLRLLATVDAARAASPLDRERLALALAATRDIALADAEAAITALTGTPVFEGRGIGTVHEPTRTAALAVLALLRAGVR